MVRTALAVTLALVVCGIAGALPQVQGEYSGSLKVAILTPPEPFTTDVELSVEVIQDGWEVTLVFQDEGDPMYDTIQGTIDENGLVTLDDPSVLRPDGCGEIFQAHMTLVFFEQALLISTSSITQTCRPIVSHGILRRLQP